MEPGSDTGPLALQELLTNLAVHNAYHLGRIVQLRQMLWKASARWWRYLVIRIPMNVDRALDPGPVLRRAVPRDIPEITAMMTDFHSEDRIAWRASDAQRAISELLANEALIEVHGLSIGFLVLTFGFSLEFHGRTAFVDEFYIRPEFRGHGIGAKVLDQMVGYCARHGIRAVHLEVEHSNPRVHRLYERAGFEDRGFYILSKWIRIGSQDEDLTISGQGERGS